MINCVFASYFNTKVDPQRGYNWPSDISQVNTLIESVVKQEVHVKIFHDCFDNPPIIKNCEFIKVPSNLDFSPTVYRWFVYLDHLQNNTYEKIFMVDSTDVVMQLNPFDYLEENILYVGSEHKRRLPYRYILNKAHLFEIKDWKTILDENSKRPLLNCGIIGGHLSIIESFLKRLTKNHYKHSKGIVESLDMPIFNYTLYKYFNDCVVTGKDVHTRFEKYEENDISWWRHK